MEKIRIITHRYAYMGLEYNTVVEIEGHCGDTVTFKHNGKTWALKDHQGDFEFMYGNEIVNDSIIKAMQATGFLSKALALLEERGKDYDQPQGERSMGKTVQAFNAITGHTLKESEGWLLLQLLKDVRQWSNPNSYHADSAEDCISYAALKAEALIEGK